VCGACLLEDFFHCMFNNVIFEIVTMFLYHVFIFIQLHVSKNYLKNYRDESRGTIPLKSCGGRVKPLIFIHLHVSKNYLKNYRDESRGTVSLKSCGGKVKPLILIAETVSQAGGKYQEIYNMLIDTNCWWLLKYNILFSTSFSPRLPTLTHLRPTSNQQPCIYLNKQDKIMMFLFYGFCENYVL
jgi:hypothetical protein